ncbi:MAG: serine--tRNA ligase, partial [Chloroflexota bacterium]
MLDIKLLRETPELVREALQKRGDSGPVEEILEKDKTRLQLLAEVEDLRNQINQRSVRIGGLRGKQASSSAHAGAGEPHDQNEVIEVGNQINQLTEESRDLSRKVEEKTPQLHELEDKIAELMLYLPNIPDPSVVVGEGEKWNRVVRHVGQGPAFTFTPLPHWEIAERLGIIDFERGVKLSGTRFYVLRGQGARLQRALINFMLDLHTREHGYFEVYLPFMVKKESMVCSGNLPRFKDNLYHDAEEDFWLVPTAEVPLTNLHRDEILEALPLYYAAYTACFRREKMAAGRETRGLKRGHQFDKVELYKFTTPETSNEELEKLVRDAGEVLERLGLPYRVKELCTGELGFAARKSYDVDLWAPGIGEWLEVSSCSNCGDFQARRARVRYRPNPKTRPQFVHTL